MKKTKIRPVGIPRGRGTVLEIQSRVLWPGALLAPAALLGIPLSTTTGTFVSISALLTLCVSSCLEKTALTTSSRGDIINWIFEFQRSYLPHFP